MADSNANYQQPQPQVVQQPQVVVTQAPVLQTQVITGAQVLHPNGACAHAVQTEDYSCCGIALAIIFFPIGILCCLCMTERRCAHCGQQLG